MMIKIGLKSVGRELALDVSQSEEEIQNLVRQAMENRSVLELTDKREAKYVINGESIAYLEIAPSTTGRVGFSL